MKLNWRIFFALMLLAVRMASGATLNITSIADRGPGTLRDALTHAADGDRIDATWVHGIIRLTSGELFIGHSLIIVGPGSDKLTVDANRLSRVFHISPGVVVSLNGLTITKGVAPYLQGGGIYNDHATLTVNKCVVTGNFGDDGAGIANDAYLGSATLNVVNSFVMGNSASMESDDGGGIFNNGEDGNATVTLSNSVVSDNNTGLFGGGIFNDGFDGSATVTLVNSIVRGNDAGSSGGGIYNAGWFGKASLISERSTVTENHAGTGGGIYNAGYGGTALLIITNCAIIGNQASYGGGFYNGCGGGNAMMILANSTISKNLATTGGGSYNSNDGDVVPISDPGNAFLQILNCTMSDNSAETIYDANCLGDTTVEIGNTILNASASGSTIGFGCSFDSNTFISLGYNLSNDDGGGALTNAMDLINTDPRLGPLRDNGGPTLTQALLSGSPAIDQGKNFSGSPFDQRGHRFARTFDNPFIPNAPGGDGTDIGAFEVQTISPAQPVQYLLELVNSQVNHPQPLRMILDAALTSINRNNLFATYYELEAFQRQVRVQVMPSDHALAAVLLQTAQDAINALNTR